MLLLQKSTDMNRLIINADDCGRNTLVNQEIRRYIENRVLTSTTVMANMDDFDGALKLYHDYSTTISFGAHLNLTEGSPLTNPDVFLETGFCKEEEDQVVFNGMSFRWKYISSTLKKAIYQELRAQIEKLYDAGITPTHIDSHQHIHFAPWLTSVFCKIAGEKGITKIRRPKNFLNNSIHDIVIRGLNIYYLTCMRKLKTTDFFSSGEAYINWAKKKDGVYELMCHPGHENQKYHNEMVLLQNYFVEPKQELLISYREL